MVGSGATVLVVDQAVGMEEEVEAIITVAEITMTTRVEEGVEGVVVSETRHQGKATKNMTLVMTIRLQREDLTH